MIYDSLKLDLWATNSVATQKSSSSVVVVTLWGSYHLFEAFILLIKRPGLRFIIQKASLSY